MKSRLSLIEHIVVIAVVAFAILVVLPMTGRARDHAKSAVCMANLHMLTQAWLDYAADNEGSICNGFVPRDAQYANTSYWLTTTSFGGPYKDNAWWVNPPHTAQGIYNGDPIPCPLSDELSGIRTGKLFPYSEDGDVYHCPGDNGYLHITNRGGWRSYSATGLMNGEQPNHPKCVRALHDIVDPGYKYVFLEGIDTRGWNMGSWIMDPYGEPPYWIDPVGVYHDERSTFGFADGHVETHTWVDASTLEMGQTARPKPINWSASEGQDIFYMVRGYVPGRR